ncbi:MAG: ATP-binding cassette subfamily F protein uup [Parvicellaceae bacterium]|jgi:ATP-binding cassette subfamily F protein uup
MNLLSVEGLSKSYGVKDLFNNVTFGIDQGQKVAFVAKNGTGKSTLLKCICGLETQDEGRVVFRKEISNGYLAQSHEFEPGLTPMEVILNSGNPIIAAIKAYQKVTESGDAGDQFQYAFDEMNRLNAWEKEVKINEILSKLKLDTIQVTTEHFSGGQTKRTALAKILIDDPDFLILDEPTNHLDLDMIEWLEEYLGKSNCTLFMVTHDRYFLDNVCTELIELDGGAIYRYKGNYSYFLQKRDERYQVQEVSISKANNLLKTELEWMRRQPKARGTKSKSRIADYHVLNEKASVKVDKSVIDLKINIKRLGTKILEFHKVSKSYGDLKILDQFNYVFKRNEKIGIVGYNGSGKSTFLKMITGELEADAGKIVVGETVSFAHYHQEGIKLKEDKRVIEVIKDIAEVIPLEKGKKISALQLLERFLFQKEQHYALVSTLSGGEKRRLYLLTILMQNPNFLILDEPTNDLDLFTLNALESYLQSFTGCLIIVSHDRFFMDKMSDHMFVFEGQGKIKDINGNYSAYRDLRKAEGASLKKQKTTPTNTRPEKEKTKLTYKEKQEFESLEKEIEGLEKEKVELTEELNQSSSDSDRIMKISKRLGQVQSEVDVKEMRWLELSEMGQ